MVRCLGNGDMTQSGFCSASPGALRDGGVLISADRIQLVRMRALKQKDQQQCPKASSGCSTTCPYGAFIKAVLKLHDHVDPKSTCFRPRSYDVFS